jgi:hypothetical protein
LEEREKSQGPTNYEDILFNQLKNAKFVHPVTNPANTHNDVKEDQNEDGGWAQFTAA